MIKSHIEVIKNPNQKMIIYILINILENIMENKKEMNLLQKIQKIKVIEIKSQQIIMIMNLSI